MSARKVTTETSGDATTVTVEDLFTMNIYRGRVVIEFATKNVHTDSDTEANRLTLTPDHPRLAYIAPEHRDDLRADLGL